MIPVTLARFPAGLFFKQHGLPDCEDCFSSRYTMTVETLGPIIAAVPIGEAIAVPQREIGKIYGIGAASSCGVKLREAVADGSIKRRKEMRPSGFAWVYWREAP